MLEGTILRTAAGEMNNRSSIADAVAVASLILDICATVLLAGLLVLRLPQGNDCIGIKRVSRFIVCTISSDNSSCLHWFLLDGHTKLDTIL